MTPLPLPASIVTFRKINQTKSAIMIKIKRAYLESEEDDSMRILVDRLWPRGLTKEKANIDLWMKDVAPSTELRKWFSHDIKKWEEFKRRYLDELNENKESVAILKEQLNKGM